jgi:uncharacterized protein YcsI (UPF0317 family)
MSKFKRRLKRVIKKAAPLLAVAGLGKAFMDARRRNQANVELDLPMSNMTSRPNRRYTICNAS